MSDLKTIGHVTLNDIHHLIQGNVRPEDAAEAIELIKSMKMGNLNNGTLLALSYSMIVPLVADFHKFLAKRTQ